MSQFTYSVDLAVEPLSQESFDYLKNIENVAMVGSDVITHIDNAAATLLGKKTPELPEEDAISAETVRRVLVIHHDGREKPTMYGASYTPHQTTLAEFSESLGTVVGLGSDERFIWGWCSLVMLRTSFGGITDESLFVPTHDEPNYTFTAWRVPRSEEYHMFYCSLGMDTGDVSPPIFLPVYDLSGLYTALKPFIDNEDIYQVLFLDSLVVPSPNLINGMWRRFTIVFGDHVGDSGVRAFILSEPATHPTASPRLLLDTWKRAGERNYRRKIKQDASADGVRSALHRSHSGHRFTLNMVDQTTIRLNISSKLRHFSFVPYIPHTRSDNYLRWCTAIYMCYQIRETRGLHQKVLSMLEMDDDAPSAQQPHAIRIPLKRHQLQNLHKMCHLEEETNFKEILMTKISDNTLWDPRSDNLFPVPEHVETSSGGFLCDTVGLGKTLSMIALCVARPPDPMFTHGTLVICPPSILVQWKREIEKHTDLRVLEYHGKKKQGETKHTMRVYDIVLTTYTTYIQSKIFSGEHPITWHRVVFDESHTMSDRLCRSKIIAKHKWCVTATPLNNMSRQIHALGLNPRYNESFRGLYYMLGPLMIRHTQRQSSQLPVLTIEDVAVQFQTTEEKQLYDQTLFNLQQMPASRIGDALRIQTYLDTLRRLCTYGSWSLESLVHGAHIMQPVTEDQHPLVPDYTLVAPHEDDDMCPICMNMYDQPVVTTCNHWFCADCIATALNIPPPKCPMCRNSQHMQELRAGVLFGQEPPEDTPISMDEENSTITAATLIHCSSKLNALASMLDTMQTQDSSSKAIVFCESSMAIPFIMDTLKTKGFKARCIHGSMPAIQRGNAIKAFQEDPRTTIFVSSLRSAAAGINLTAANHIFFLAPVMNQANYTQGIGRAHRTGQMRPVKVYRMYIEGTIEEKMLVDQQWNVSNLYSLFY